ncbi:tyrosine-type recombinase/integrase [Streptomyces sp. NPDC050844]|uniref:tyrosine-type recombinase/integrase n=1 Tax=Streptomyces sp. NPDC050844 TaxID=3155790 RepID=UPI0033D5B080
MGLPKELSPHGLRHSYVTPLTEDGVDRRFIQQQVGHECDSSLAIYTQGRNRRWPPSSTTTGTCAKSADRGMFSTTDLLPPLAERGITAARAVADPVGLITGLRRSAHRAPQGRRLGDRAGWAVL